MVRVDRARRQSGHRSGGDGAHARAGGRLDLLVGRRTGAKGDANRRAAFLLPNYDEYLIAHKDRGLVIGPGSGDGVTRIKDPFMHHVIIDGRLAGSWTRTVNARSVVVGCSTYARPTGGQTRDRDRGCTACSIHGPWWQFHGEWNDYGIRRRTSSKELAGTWREAIPRRLPAAASGDDRTHSVG